MDSHWREFLAETEDALEALFDDLRALRAADRTDGRARRELVGSIFRRVHTIKGSSATVELSEAALIAHEFETLLDGVRLGRVAVDDEVLDAFEDAAHAISQSLRMAARGHAEQPTEQALIERLRRLSHTESNQMAREGATSLLLAALPEEMARSLGEQELNRAREAIEEGSHLAVVNVTFDIKTFDDSFRDLSRALSEGGEIISTLPGIEATAPEKISFRILYAAPSEREELHARLSAFGQLSITEIRTEGETEKDETDGARPSFVESSSAEAQRESIVPVSKHVRVELSELDEIIAATHEVLIDTTAAFAAAADVSDDLQTEERNSIERRAESVRRRLLELEEKLIGLRMIPIARMLERAARAGRATARQTGKEIDVELKGTNVRLDKTLADAIADPLLHILRNAVDHGIETPAERAAAGKSVRGLIRLEAVAESNRVRLKVVDDGRGIDPLRVARAASAQGIIEASRTLTKEHALRLIFRPGFSTRSVASNVSGRGVGLDVVESAVEQMGGQLRVASEPGAGSTFEIILPTTLALMQAYLVRSYDHRYCVNASHVVETGFITPDEIERSGTLEQIRWRGALVPVVRMRRLLAQPSRESGDAETGMPAIVVSDVASEDGFETENGKQTAIIVDALEGEMEALVRGLGRHGARWRGVSGATSLRDGSVALVLDLPRLLDAAS
jgi:two-component system chemotaxis sensor kinase CheA